MKVYDVNFKKKKLNFVFDDGIKKNPVAMQALIANFGESLKIISNLTDDTEFRDYVAQVFRGIINKLK